MGYLPTADDFFSKYIMMKYKIPSPNPIGKIQEIPQINQKQKVLPHSLLFYCFLNIKPAEVNLHINKEKFNECQ